ncbi:MAG: aldo/keto reductase [Deltaproteobacteria bacterium]|nr:MAG: aldo/keto reductase [Deltaproteobacteria bacterium]
MSVNKKSWSRRDFLKTVGAAGMGTLFTASDFQKAVSAATNSMIGTMPLRPFGKTGVSVPILGFGGSQNLESKQRLLRQAVKLGVTYWDTAETYAGGGSEEAMGKYFETYPGDRKKIFLVTKSHAASASGLSDSLDGSLERLGISYIDLYLVHGIGSPSEMDDEIRVWSEKKKAEGKIQFIGFSAHNNMDACMMGAAKLGWIDGIMVTYNYRLMHTDPMKRAVEACVKAGIGLTAMKTQAGWSWGYVGKRSKTAAQLIEGISRKGFTEEQAKLKAVWENPHIASICSEMTNFKILASNVAAARNQTRLSLKDNSLLNRYAHETASQYCAGCAYICESVLEEDLPVSDTLRFLMYARCYGEPERAKACFRGIPPHVRKQMVQADYTAAETACPQGIPIGRLMKEAESELA